MARSYDIADLMTSDGEYITDNVRRKINGNFRRVLQIMQQELPAAEKQSIVSTVTVIVDNLLDKKLDEIIDQVYEESYPIGSVITTTTSGDPRLSHGTWQQIGGGSYIRAAGGDISVMDTGGDGEVVLTEENIPLLSHDIEEAGAHSHSMKRYVYDYGAMHDAGLNKSIPAIGSYTNTAFDLDTSTNSSAAHTHDAADHGVEDPEPIKIEPEYIALLFYRRIS